MTQNIETVFALLFFAPLAVLLLLLLRQLWYHNAPDATGDSLGIEIKITGLVALSLLIGTALMMWYSG